MFGEDPRRYLPALAHLSWPCSPNAYRKLDLKLATEFSGLSADFAQSAAVSGMADADDRRAAMELSLGLCWPWLMYAAGTLMEAAASGWPEKEAKTPDHNQFKAWILSSEAEMPAGIAGALMPAVPIPTPRMWAKSLVNRLRCMLQPAVPRLAGTNPSSLFSLAAEAYQWNCSENALAIDAVTAGLTRNPAGQTALRQDVIDLAPALQQVLGHLDLSGPMQSRLLRVCIAIYSTALNRTIADMRGVQRHVSRATLGPMLYSGTPKQIGRVLSWWATRHDIPVHRFAHGGDRATHIDAGWELVELSFCSNYIVHGMAERENIEARFSDGKIGARMLMRPQIVTFGSRKHAEISASPALAAKHSGTRPRLLYVAASYNDSRMVFAPNFKLPDMLYLEWQRWLLKALVDLGYDVSVKHHPRSSCHGELLLGDGPWRHVNGFMDATKLDADCLLFDFPGSAWFDAMASNLPISLIDIGPRMVDSRTRSVLEARCPIISSEVSNVNLLRVDLDELRMGIEKAMAVDRADMGAFHRIFYSASTAA